ncbi:hypothetical protein FVEG_06996 [Fusarium verticillioides 7600]|uniref:Uncharacterized protein n=1 Tax=Gibberella moniliformis (strain M3125 / FGSC 7600) TaxID=334819 RepID=W7MPJ6_GIBM7|nr:hypothetical protein FVEG_06996 [Fusarium verticillioides 7600]EWG46552.1 hypothetical protein FVEG_06996 [Fusarium verticillioides 7600]
MDHTQYDSTSNQENIPPPYNRMRNQESVPPPYERVPAVGPADFSINNDSESVVPDSETISEVDEPEELARMHNFLDGLSPMRLHNKIWLYVAGFEDRLRQDVYHTPDVALAGGEYSGISKQYLENPLCANWRMLQFGCFGDRELMDLVKRLLLKFHILNVILERAALILASREFIWLNQSAAVRGMLILLRVMVPFLSKWLDDELWIYWDA